MTPNKSPEPTRVIAFSFIHKISGLPSHRSRVAQLSTLGGTREHIENMNTTIRTLLIGCLFLVGGCCTSSTSSDRASDLVILKAVYGVGTVRSVDMTSEVRSLVKDGAIHLHPRWGFSVDPAAGEIKRITVAYRYKGQVGVATFDQTEEFVLPVSP